MTGSATVNNNKALDGLLYARFPSRIGLCLIVIGALVFVGGWGFEVRILRNLHPDWVTMKPNTALGIMLAGFAIVLLARSDAARSRRLSLLPAAAILALGAITLSQDIFKINVGIDLAFFADRLAGDQINPGRMSPITAVNFMLLGAALLLRNSSNIWAARIAETFAAFSIGTALLALIGYLYNVPSLYGAILYTSIAVHTASLILLVATATFLIDGQGGLAGLIASDAAGGMMARRLLLPAILVPIMIGLMRIKGQEYGLYDTIFGIALLVLLHIFVFTALILLNVRTLNQVDRERQRLDDLGRVSAALARVSQFSANVIETTTDAFISVNATGVVEHWNHAAERMFGIPEAQAIGRPLVDLVVAEADGANFLLHISTSPQAEGDVPVQGQFETTLKSVKGHGFPVSISISSMEHEGKVQFNLFIRDISLAKKREYDLAEAQAAAAAADNAKSDFLHRMSHELRTPLNAVIGFVQVLELERHGTLTPHQKAYCQHIRTGGEHLLNLVTEVLDLARIESGNMKLSIERIRVADALGDAMNILRPIAEKAAIRLDVTHAAGVPDILADDMRLRQILLNLVSNAIKYNKKNGSVSLSAAMAPDGKVRVAVADTGIGMSEAQQADLFTPFRRLGAEYTAIEGAGIGLSITKRLVEAMGGSIGYMTQVGEGSTFWIDLPVATEPQLLERKSRMALASGDGMQGRCNLLYIEDNPANLKLMEYLIEPLQNIAFLSAPLPQLGLDLALAHTPDIIVLDLNMPGMSGYEVLARLRAAPETRNIPVIALTAAAMPVDVERGLAAGFFRYLTKPIDLKILLSAIEAALMIIPESGSAGSEKLGGQVAPK